jgi:hypothetical protein
MIVLLGILVIVNLSAQQRTKPMPSQPSAVSTSESLLVLERPDPEFQQKITDAGMQTAPHSASGLIWLLPTSTARELRTQQTATIGDVSPALRLQIEVQSSADDIRPSIERLGGVVLEAHGNLHVVAVPVTKLPQLRKLPGVTRVSKINSKYPTRQ